MKTKNYFLSLTAILVMTAFMNADVAAQTNLALNFDGVDDYVIVPNSPSIQPGAEMTVECWAKSNTALWNNYGFLVNKGISPNGAFILHPNIGTKDVAFYIHHTAGLSVNTFIAPASFDITQWHHYAGTYDGTTGEINLYVDGNLIIHDFTNAGDVVSTNGDLSIGYDQCCGGRYLNGMIDEVRLWNVMRNQAQIQASMNCPLNVPQSGLLAYYNFNNPAATANANNNIYTTLADNSGNGNNGTLGGFGLIGPTSNWVDGEPNCASAIPTLSQWGLIIFALLLLCTGAIAVWNGRYRYRLA